MTPVMEAELTDCHLAVAEGRMDIRHFSEYEVNYRAYRWRLGCVPWQ